MNPNHDPHCACNSSEHINRRALLKGTAGIAGLSWLTPLADLLAVEAQTAAKGKPAPSLLVSPPTSATV